MDAIAVAFAALMLLNLAVELTLGWRQMRHVHRHRSAVPEPFAGTISPEEHERAAAYTLARGRVARIAEVVATLTLAAWTLGGGLQALDDASRRIWTAPRAVGVGFIVGFMLLSSVLSLPLSLYRTFGVEARFGFNTTTWKTYLVDLVKGTLISLALVVPLSYAILSLVMYAGPAWWLYTWALWMTVQLLLLWLYPALIAPLFNKFTPLADATILARVQALLDRCGFAARGVFIMDGSRRSSHGNAYFTGMGRNKRVVFFDTLLKSLAIEEIEGVLAHELGHFKLRHVTKRIALSAVASFLGLAVLGWLIDAPWFYHSLGVQQPSPHAALILLLLAAPVVTFFFSPLSAWYSRRHEFEADRYAAHWANAAALARALTKLYRDNASTLTPDPWHSWMYDSHPPALVRIAFLRRLAEQKITD